MDWGIPLHESSAASGFTRSPYEIVSCVPSTVNAVSLCGTPPRLICRRFDCSLAGFTCIHTVIYAYSSRHFRRPWFQLYQVQKCLMDELVFPLQCPEIIGIRTIAKEEFDSGSGLQLLVIWWPIRCKSSFVADCCIAGGWICISSQPLACQLHPTSLPTYLQLE